MIDRTTKALLLAIAVGLWVNITGVLEPTPAHAQALAVSESVQLEAIVSELKKISSNTAATNVALQRIWTTGR